MTRRMPTDICVLCNRSLDETGGQRIIATNNVGVSLRSIQDRLDSFHHPPRAFRLENRWREVVLVMWGHVWDREAIERARQVAQEGLRPWFCQRCVGKVICSRCGQPMRPVAGADVLDDDGQVRHVFVIAGMATKCRNPDCDDFAG